MSLFFVPSIILLLTLIDLSSASTGSKMEKKGFGVPAQVDLADFQSIPESNFKFLLNYVDHGIKTLTCIPIVAKSCIGPLYDFH